MRIKNDALFTSQSMGASFASEAVFVGHIYGWAVQGSWTGGGAPTGDFFLQVSCDEGRSESDSTGVTNWTTTDTVNVAANSGSFFLNKDAQYARWVRLIYTRTGGSATASARINLKGN